jgi:hypothetical protein
MISWFRDAADSCVVSRKSLPAPQPDPPDHIAFLADTRWRVVRLRHCKRHWILFRFAYMPHAVRLAVSLCTANEKHSLVAASMRT